MTQQDSKQEETEARVQDQVVQLPSRYFYRVYRFISRSCLLILGMFTRLVVILAILIGILIYSQSSREWFIEKLLPELLAFSSINLEIDKFSSPLLDEWHFEALSIQIDNEPLLDVKRLLLKWDMASLFIVRLDVQEFSADSVRIYLNNIQRDPVAEPVEEPAYEDFQDALAYWSNALFPIRIQTLAISNLEIHSEALSLPLLSVMGDIQLLWGKELLETGLSIKFTDASNKRPDTDITLHGKFDQYLNGQFSLSVSEDSGGWLHAFLQLPQAQSIRVDTEIAILFSGQTFQADVIKFDGNWLEHQLDIQGQVSWQDDTQRLLISDLQLLVDGQSQVVQGWWQKDELDLKLSLENLPISLLSPFQDMLDTGTLSGKLDVVGALTKPTFQARLSADTLYKDHAVFLEIQSRGDAQQMVIDNAHLQLNEAQMDLNGRISLTDNAIDLNISHLQGPITFLSVFDVIVPDELVMDLRLDQGKVAGTFSKPVYTGKLQAEGIYSDTSFAAQSEFSGDLQRIDIVSFTATSENAELKAHGQIDWYNERLDLNIDASKLPVELLSLAELSIPEELKALLNINGELAGEFQELIYTGAISTAGSYSDMVFSANTDVTASASRIELHQFDSVMNTANSAQSSIAGDIIFYPESMQLDGMVTVQQLPYSFAEIFKLEIPASLSGYINTDLELSGTLTNPSINGSFDSKGTFQNAPFNISLSGGYVSEKLSLSEAKASWKDSTLSAQGELSLNYLDFHLDVNNFQFLYLEDFGFPVQEGQADLELTLTGSANMPFLNGNLRLESPDSVYPTQANGSTESFIIRTDIQTINERLQLDTHVTQGDKTRGNVSLSSVYLPYIQSLLSDHDKVGFREQNLNLAISSNLNIDWINEFIDHDLQSLKGELIIDADISGKIAEPHIHGRLSLEQANYQNKISRSSIEDIYLKLSFNERLIQIDEARAHDGKGGKFTLSGDMDLTKDAEHKLNLELTMDQTTLIQREDIEGKASGTVTVSGNFSELLVKGRINVAPFQVMLDRLSFDSVPELDVVYTDDLEEPGAKTVLGPLIKLDINVDVNQQAFIRGRGLDAEMMGQLKISGTADTPYYHGRFQVIRGKFDLFGKRFNLQRGDILFSDDAVSLYVEGIHKGKDMDFIATLSGTLDELSITLRTIPDLPEDEALARLLFGKSIRNINAIQAIQLAAAIQTLRGQGSAFDPMTQARQILRVDTLTVETQETAEGQGLNIGVGKYLTEKIYLEIQRTPEPAQPWKGSVELELTPNLNLETTTGGSSGFGGLELKWKNDY